MAREHPDHKALAADTPVHVEFDGMIYDEGAFPKYPASPNHVAVSDGGFIHHIHRNSDKVTVTPPPKPEFKLGQVYRADGRNYVVYEEVEFAFGPERWYLCGPRDEHGACTLQGAELYERYPDAHLVVDPDGSLPLVGF